MTLPPMNELLAFQKVATHLSFKRAAEELSLTPSTLSHLIGQFEKRLNARLFNRTTRSVSLTDAGHKLFQQVNSVLLDLNDAMINLNADSGNPHGTVRINANEVAAHILLNKLGPQFYEQYPTINIEITVDNKLVDIVSEGFDAGIRLKDSIPVDMIAVPLIETFRFVLVASSGYIKKFGKPKKPADLVHHQCIGFRFQSGRIFEWEFLQAETSFTMDVKSALTTNHPGLLLQAVRHGLGIAHIAEPLIQREIRNKELVVLLDKWNRDWPGLCLYFPNNRYMPPALRAVIDFIKTSQN